MKPFTVESYKAGKKAICRNGQVPEQLTYFETNEGHCFAAIISGVLETFHSDGIYIDSTTEQDYDLFEQEDVVETWHVSYPYNTHRGYKSLEEAKATADPDAISILKLTYNHNKPENEQYSVEVVHKY